jgi:hypothetical protein
MVEIIANQLASIGVLVTIVSIVNGAGAVPWIGVVDGRLARATVGVIAYQAVASISSASILVAPCLVGVGVSCAA